MLSSLSLSSLTISLSVSLQLQKPPCSTVLKTFATPYCRSSSYARKFSSKHAPQSDSTSVSTDAKVAPTLAARTRGTETL